MAQELRQSTEIKVRMGPFVDVSDGYTPETGITLGAADEAELLKHNGVATVDISGATWAAVTGCDGWYDLTLTTSYTDTLGQLDIVVQDDSACLPVHKQFLVVTQNYWDSKYSTDNLEVDVVAVSGDSTAADNLELDYDGTGYAKANSTIGTTTTNTDMRGTDSAALAATALSNATWTDARAGYLDNINGHTAQTGDNYARLGAPAGASVSADIAAIKAETAEIGAAGAGLTAVPWNASWDTEVQSEVNDALVALNLDHWVAVATAGADMTAEVVDNSILSRILANGDTSAFDPSTDGLQPIRDRGDAAWITATTVDLNADQSGVTIGTVSGTVGSVTGNVGGNIVVFASDVVGDRFARADLPIRRIGSQVR